MNLNKPLSLYNHSKAHEQQTSNKQLKALSCAVRFRQQMYSLVNYTPIIDAKSMSGLHMQSEPSVASLSINCLLAICAQFYKKIN